MERGPRHLPVLSRLDLGLVRSPGPGLGNLLFPIARALIGRERHGGAFIHPTMRQVKIGTLLRRERDPRFYGDVFRGRNAGEWRDWLACRFASRTPEADYQGGPGVVAYSGLGRYFHDLAGYREPVSDWIRDRAILNGPVEADYDIGIHVRQGDFTAAREGSSGHSMRQSFDWDRQAFAEARALSGTSHPKTFLFTDEDPARVASGLGIAGVGIDPSGNAITAILNLSRARIVIASRSTFSTWAIYLGDAVAIWDRDFDLAFQWAPRGKRDVFLARQEAGA